MAVSFICAFPSLAFAHVPCRVSALLRILCGEQRRAASGVVAVLGLWLWSWSTSRCLWPFVCVRGVVPPLRGSSPLPTLGVVRSFALGFSPSPACFHAPQKVAFDFRAPCPQADAGVARGWVALACAGKAQVRDRGAAPPRPQRTWGGAALLLRSSWFWFPTLLSAAALLGFPPVSPTCQRPATGRDGDSEWVGVAEARQTEGVGAWSVLPPDLRPWLYFSVWSDYVPLVSLPPHGWRGGSCGT